MHRNVFLCLLLVIVCRVATGGRVHKYNMASKLISTTARLTRLRGLMSQTQNLKAYIVPTGDDHQSEYISEHDARRQFISGFTGSAGTVVVTPEQALLWTDGRYYLQAENQLDENWTLMKESLPTTPTREKWLLSNLPPKSNVGANPLHMSNTDWEPLQKSLQKAGHQLIPVVQDLIDVVWEQDEEQRPSLPKSEIFPLPEKYSGKTISKKLLEVRKQMVEKNSTAVIITDLAELAHLFNLRGSDIPFNPVFYAYAIVTTKPDKLYLMTRSELFNGAVRTHFQTEGVADELEILPYETALDAIKSIVSSIEGETVEIWVSHGSSRAVHIAANFDTSKVNLVTDITPLSVMKAVKNDVETQGLINCHIRDGAALAKYFAWLEEEIVTNGNKTITEISAADQLEKFRSQLPDFVGLSFTTISGSGPNGAVIHYKPEASTNRPLSVDEMYLCDSGAQFWDGTTDVTRTMHFGTPTAAQREAFTLVLKGQIALGMSIFPTKIKGNVLDTIARRELWQRGMNYAHGTGHGIGHFLNVHEGPMGISWRQMPNDPGLETNMFLSNEPGYYEDGEYGIRIEDIIRVVTLIPPGNVTSGEKLPRGLKGNFAGQGALGFETVTMAPIQRKLIDLDLLTEEEITYLDAYHKNVYDKVSVVLDSMNWGSVKTWLAENTRPLRSK